MYIRILMRCNQGVEPYNALLHNAILSFLSVLSFLSHRVTSHHIASHRVTPVTASPLRHTQTERVRPPDSGLRARGGGAVKLCLPPGNNGRGFEEGHLHRFTWHTHPQQTYSDEPISAPTRC